MALLVCPDCGGNVSSKAAKCPRCGCPVSIILQEMQNSEKAQEPEPHNEVPVQNTEPEPPTIEKKKAVEPDLQNVETTQTVEPQPSITEHKQKTETSNGDTKWSQGALIGGALIAVIVIIAIVFFFKKSSNTDYTSQYEPNDESITVNGVSFKMIKVDGGSFNMGSNDSDAYDDEKPVHRVTLNTFYIGETEVTQGLWKAVMGNNPSYFCNGDNFPVEGVSWNDCQEFIQKLNAKTGKKFSLPTEAQWEYAALGGRKSLGYTYSGNNSISIVGWYDSNCDNTTHRVKALSANELGLYDMTGNVYEWCQDWYADRYESNSLTDPIGPNYGTLRVVRSGSWKSKSRNCRVAYRFKYAPDYKFRNLGLRLCINTTTSHNYTESTNSEIQNSAEATRKLNDFKRKITSYPFEKDAIEIIEVIDNNNTKCLFFKNQTVETYDENGSNGIIGTFFMYNAATDKLYELNNTNFIERSFNVLTTKKYEENWEQPYAFEKNTSRGYEFSIYKMQNQRFLLQQYNYLSGGDGTVIEFSLPDLHTKCYERTEIYKNKYLIVYENYCPMYLDTRTYTVRDLQTGNDIQNPFIKTGNISFFGNNNTSVDLTINNNASVTGRVVYEGKTYSVTGNETIYQDINLAPNDNNEYHEYYFTITRKDSKYMLKKVMPVAEYCETISSIEVFKK